MTTYMGYYQGNIEEDLAILDKLDKYFAEK